MQTDDVAKLLVEKEWKAEIAALHKRLDCIKAVLEKASDVILADDDRKIPTSLIVYVMSAAIIAAPPSQEKTRLINENPKDDPIISIAQLIIKTVEADVVHVRRQILEA